jgi:hypothetical protein
LKKAMASALERVVLDLLDDAELVVLQRPKGEHQKVPEELRDQKG